MLPLLLTAAGVYFAAPPSEISAILAGQCMDAMMVVADVQTTQVTCSQEIKGLRGDFAQLVYGNSYSTRPQQMIRFIIIPHGKGSRAQWSEWIETQMAGGQVRRQDIGARKRDAAIQRWLLTIGGTTSP